MHEKQEMSQQHVCKLRQRSRWKEWGKCRSTDWRTRENRWKYSVLFFLQFIRCLIQSALFTDVWNWFSFSILRTTSALQHTGGIAISYCCATGGTLHTWDGRISLDLKQIDRFPYCFSFLLYEHARRHRADIMQIYGVSLKPVLFHKNKTYLNNTNTACLFSRGLLNGCLLIDKWFLSEITVISTVSTMYFLNQSLLTQIYLHISQFSLYRERYIEISGTKTNFHM